MITAAAGFQLRIKSRRNIIIAITGLRELQLPVTVRGRRPRITDLPELGKPTPGTTAVMITTGQRAVQVLRIRPREAAALVKHGRTRTPVAVAEEAETNP